MAAPRSQIYQNHAHVSRAASPIQRFMATNDVYLPDPGALGFPTISDGNRSPSRFVTRSCKLATTVSALVGSRFCGTVTTDRAPSEGPGLTGAAGSTEGSLSLWPDAAIPLASRPPLTDARCTSGIATLLAELRTSEACRGRFTGLDSVLWQGNRHATRSGSSVVHAAQFTCRQ